MNAQMKEPAVLLGLLSAVMDGSAAPAMVDKLLNGTEAERADPQTAALLRGRLAEHSGDEQRALLDLVDDLVAAGVGRGSGLEQGIDNARAAARSALDG
jgi:hypothetical protein